MSEIQQITNTTVTVRFSSYKYLITSFFLCRLVIIDRRYIYVNIRLLFIKGHVIHGRTEYLNSLVVRYTIQRICMNYDVSKELDKYAEMAECLVAGFIWFFCGNALGRWVSRISCKSGRRLAGRDCPTRFSSLWSKAVMVSIFFLWFYIKFARYPRPRANLWERKKFLDFKIDIFQTQRF